MASNKGETNMPKQMLKVDIPEEKESRGIINDWYLTSRTDKNPAFLWESVVYYFENKLELSSNSPFPDWGFKIKGEMQVFSFGSGITSQPFAGVYITESRIFFLDSVSRVLGIRQDSSLEENYYPIAIAEKTNKKDIVLSCYGYYIDWQWVLNPLEISRSSVRGKTLSKKFDLMIGFKSLENFDNDDLNPVNELDVDYYADSLFELTFFWRFVMPERKDVKWILDWWLKK